MVFELSKFWRLEAGYPNAPRLLVFELRVKGRERPQREGREEEGESERVRGGKGGERGSALEREGEGEADRREEEG